MEPVTHFLTGSALARVGLNRRSAYTTAVMVLAAEAPDLDVLWGFKGPVSEFQHHRGWTHSFLGGPVVALVTVAVVLGVMRLARHRPALPVRIGWLLLCAWLATLSHLLLDWTNNYGLRPLLPFNWRWYQGEIVFILEPVILLALMLAVVVPWLLGMTDREIGGRVRGDVHARRWAWMALIVMLATWGVREVEHQRARTLIASREWPGAPRRIMLSPYPVNPFLWHAVVDCGDLYQTARVNSWTGNVLTEDTEDVYRKPAVSAPISTAEASALGRVYLDWSQVPLVSAEEPVQDPNSPLPSLLTPVNFRDLRFNYPVLPSGVGNSATSALSAQVLVGSKGDIVEQRLGMETQR